MNANLMIVGQPLFTQDGRRIGNALIVKNDVEHSSNYKITTDFGNDVMMSESDINSVFYVSRTSDELVYPRLVDSPPGSKGFVIAYSTATSINERILKKEIDLEILPWKDSLDNAVVQVKLVDWPTLITRLGLPKNWI